MTGRITALQSRQVDPAVTVGNRFDPDERVYIDIQIRAIQQFLVEALLNEVAASYFTLDPSSSAVAPGHVVCLSSNSTHTVTLALATPLGNAKRPLGVVLSATTPGSVVRVALFGIVVQSITGLAAGSPGLVRVSSSGTLERVASLAGGDWPVGSVDNAGNLTLACERQGGGGGSAGVTTATPDELALRDGTGGCDFAYVRAGAVGSGYATAGNVRLPNNTLITARNNLNSLNASVATLSTGDVLKLGDDSVVAGVELRSKTASGVTCYANNTAYLTVLPSAITYAPVQAGAGAGAASSIRGQKGAAGSDGGALSIGGGDPGTNATGHAGNTIIKLGAQDLASDFLTAKLVLDQNGTTIGQIYNNVGSLKFESVSIGLVITSAGATSISSSNNTYVNGPTDVHIQANAVDKVVANTTGLGFFAATPVAKPTVTGSRGGNAALASALTALASLGLLTDSSSA